MSFTIRPSQPYVNLHITRKRVDNLYALSASAHKDKVLSGLREERYRKMTDGYEAEQETLKNEIAALNARVERQ